MDGKRPGQVGWCPFEAQPGSFLALGSSPDRASLPYGFRGQHYVPCEQGARVGPPYYT